MNAIDLGMDFQMPKNESSAIKVLGIGGGGSNAVNYMFANGIKGVDFVICNTDNQALEASPVPVKIQLGKDLTEGLGAGANPEIGRKAAEESADRITELLDANTKMLFITAGMGGGTGTGAAPVIAEIAQEKGILTVGVVTIPFGTEGGYRRQYADAGITELKKYVDTLLVINNEKLIEVYGDLTFTNAFAKANEVLNTATKGIAEVISEHLLVNIDLNDARKVLENSGTAVMGQSKVEGENRAIEAVTEALDSPLLNDNDITGAQQVLLKIVTGDGEGEIKMSELGKIKNKIQEVAGANVNIIEGIGIDPELGMAISVTVIATGFEERRAPKGPTTVKLGEDSFDTMSTTETKEVQPSVSALKEIEPTQTQHTQQALPLDDEIDFSISEIETTTEVEDVIKPVVESHNTPEKIVFDLGNEYAGVSLEEEESADEVITSIMLDEESKEINPTVVPELEEEEEITEPTLNTFESSSVSSEVLKVEARERENRLRTISMQLRTPSGLTSLEDVPAYKRENIDTEQPTHSSESEVSSYTLTNGNDNITELKQNNSFLHDNVD